MVLVRSEVSVSSCDVSKPLGLVISALPSFHNKSSAVPDWTVFPRKNVASAGQPSDDSVSGIEVEHFSVVVLWQSQLSLVLAPTDV